jgi:3-dehydroquinate synthase
MRTVHVDLGRRSYNIHVGGGLLDTLGELVEPGSWKKALVVTDANVRALHGGCLLESLERLVSSVELFEIATGESSKNPDTALELIDAMVRFGLTRADVVVAFGGGVVGDLAGFAASIYKRGVACLQVPTTLMSQVDSAIGGKTGVNLPAGKNLVGSFHQPVAVVCDVRALATLPAREFRSGLAEVVKYALIGPADRVAALEELAPGLRAGEAGEEELVDIVSECACDKAAVVAADEFDTGMRAILNYGHTLGHALETGTGYEGVYSHGEAVAVGMVFAAIVSERLDAGPRGMADVYRGLLSSLGLPTAPFQPVPDFDVMLRAMAHDKKSTGQLTMVLLENGKPVARDGLDADMLARCFKELGDPR